MANKASSSAAPTDTDAADQRKARIEATFGEAGSEKRKTRRNMVIKIYNLLTKTPADESGLVEGTPFSVTGVERLMAILQRRADEPSEAGSKAAAGMVKFLTPDSDSAEAIGGVSVEKLRWIASMGKRFKK